MLYLALDRKTVVTTEHPEKHAKTAEAPCVYIPVEKILRMHDLQVRHFSLADLDRFNRLQDITKTDIAKLVTYLTDTWILNI